MKFEEEEEKKIQLLSNFIAFTFHKLYVNWWTQKQNIFFWIQKQIKNVYLFWFLLTTITSYHHHTRSKWLNFSSTKKKQIIIIKWQNKMSVYVLYDDQILIPMFIIIIIINDDDDHHISMKINVLCLDIIITLSWTIFFFFQFIYFFWINNLR